MRSKTRGVFAQTVAAATGFNAHKFHIGVFQEFVEQSDGIGAASNASVEMRGQAFFGFQNLRAGLASNHRLEIAHHRGIGVRAQN